MKETFTREELLRAINELEGKIGIQEYWIGKKVLDLDEMKHTMMVKCLNGMLEN